MTPWPLSQFAINSIHDNIRLASIRLAGTGQLLPVMILRREGLEPGQKRTNAHNCSHSFNVHSPYLIPIRVFMSCEILASLLYGLRDVVESGKDTYRAYQVSILILRLDVIKQVDERRKGRKISSHNVSTIAMK
jgi:hypothetical protein